MNIIITGGSRGIGKEVALAMSSEKDNQILITGRDEDAMKKVSDMCGNGNVSYIHQDLTRLEKEMVTVRESILNRFSKVDILINCAGALTVMDFMKINSQDARIMMETNFFGPAAMIRLLVPLMPAGSHIINISSMGGFQGSSKYPGLAFYSASKAAIACLTECLASEFSNKGIAVNCLALGSVQTEMFEAAFPGLTTPVEPAEIAKFISYFAVNGNRFFNGKILPVAVNNP